MPTTGPINEELLNRIRSARALPSPPAVTVRMIEIGDDPNVSLDDIIDVLKTDPALAARILRLANSPLYARRRRTENLRQAVTLLGVDAVITASLSLTLSTFSRNQNSPSKEFFNHRWTRSVHAAVAAQILATRVAGVVAADAFLASLLQDIGVQVVVRLEPEAYATASPDCTHDAIVAIEIELLGVDHAAIGAALLDDWKLPEHIVDAVRDSHVDHVGNAIGSTPLSRIVSVSGLLADGLNGDVNALAQAADMATESLSIDRVVLAAAIDEIAAALPELASVLNAKVPDSEVLAELAQDVILARQIKTQSITSELQSQLVTMTNVAEELSLENRLDPLTGLSNRRDLDDVLAREFATAKASGFPLSVLFVDLDDFKKVNDRFGHNVGDEMLIQAARRISGCVREGDIVGRYGGEEFVVVLPGADVVSSNAAARRLIERFNCREFELGSELSLSQTTSIGIATLEGQCPYANVGDLVHAADVALYTAKSNGKNQWQRAVGGEGAGEAIAEIFDAVTTATS